MATEFKLPDLGEGVDSIDVLSMFVSTGDSIEVDQAIFEGETGKAVVEVPSSVAGVIKEIKVKEGDTLTPGAVVMTVDESGNGKKSEDSKKPEKDAKDKKSKPSQKDEKEDKVEASESSAEKEEKAAPKKEEEPQPPASPSRIPVPAAPSVRKFAREIGIDVEAVEGSGPGGRISQDDVKAYARANRGGGGGIASAGTSAPATRTEKLSKLRQTAAKHLGNAWSTIPHVTLCDKADSTDLETFRQQHKKRAAAAGGSLTITPLLMKVVTAALRANPVVNASVDLDKQQVTYHGQINLGIAVDTPRGLVVPVIRNVDQKSLYELAKELNEIGAKARDGKLSATDMQGATFTISNLGSIGVSFFTPIVNAPEVAILGVGRAVKEPVWCDGSGQFVPRLMCPLSLSFDHRLVDGADGARCLQSIVQTIQNPMNLLL